MICLLAAPWVCSTIHCPLTAVSQLLLVRLSNASLLVISLVSSSLSVSVLKAIVQLDLR